MGVGSAMKTSLLADVGFLVGVAVVSMASEDGSCRRAKGKEWSPRSGSGSPTPAGVFVANVQVCESSLSYIVMCLPAKLHLPLNVLYMLCTNIALFPGFLCTPSFICEY